MVTGASTALERLEPNTPNRFAADAFILALALALSWAWVMPSMMTWPIRSMSAAPRMRP